MSCVIVLTPVIIASWPAIAGAIVAATASMGWELARDQDQAGKVVGRQSTAVDLANVDVVAAALGRGEKITARRGDITVTFASDPRGRFSVHVDGPLAKAELERIGNELGGAVVQQYMHRRLGEELAAQGFITVEEERTPDRTIRMRVRRYEA